MELQSKEFYRTPNGEIMISDECGSRILTKNDRAFISEMLKKMWEFWPDALASLSKEYAKCRPNIPEFEYRIVCRFLKCNFGRFDSTLDIDQLGNFHFEEVECPLRGECKLEGIVCRPKFNSKLSDREIEVMHYYYKGMHVEYIADQLCISPETVLTHKRNALQRTDTHSLQGFFVYARNNNLFNQ